MLYRNILGDRNEKSILITALFAFSALLFAKENKKADSYKTHETTDKNVPVVYFIRDITPEALVKVYEATEYFDLS